MLLQSLKKEIKLISLDAHSVAVLLIMPVIFMLIMTLAASGSQSDILDSIDIRLEQYEAESQPQLLLATYLERQGVRLSEEVEPTATLTFAKHFADELLSSNQQKLELVFSEQVSPQIKAIVKQQVEMAFAKLKLHLFLLDSEMIYEDSPLEEQFAAVEKQTNSEQQIQQSDGEQRAEVTEYSIPSWIVFGVYFVVLPISITLLSEEQNGTLIRLKTFPVRLSHFFFIKLSSYYLISLVQFLILSAIGLFLVPRLIDLPPYSVEVFFALFPIMVVTSLAAVSFAAVIATQVKTYEQAIVIGGGINIILAALSGFMVPLDIMPQAMQEIAQYSPMQWSAALLKATMRQEFRLATSPETLYLLLFSGLSLALATALFRRKTRNLLWS